MKPTYTSGMNDPIHVLDSFDKPTGILKILYLYKLEVVHMLRPSFHHGLSLGQSPCGAAHADAPCKQSIDDVGADKAGRTSN